MWQMACNNDPGMVDQLSVQAQRRSVQSNVETFSRPPNLHLNEAWTLGQRSWRSARIQILLISGLATILFFCSRVHGDLSVIDKECQRLLTIAWSHSECKCRSHKQRLCFMAQGCSNTSNIYRLRATDFGKPYVRRERNMWEDADGH